MVRASLFLLILAAVLLLHPSCCSGENHHGEAQVNQCLKLALSTPPFVFHLNPNEKSGLVGAAVLLDLQEPPSKDVCPNLYIGVRYTTWPDASGVLESTNGTFLLPDMHYTWSQWFTWKAYNDYSIVKNSTAQVLYLPKQIEKDMFYMFQVHIKRGKRFRAKIDSTAGWLSRLIYMGIQVPMTLEPFPLSRRRVQENSTITLECMVTGKPLPQVTWLQSLEFPSPATTEGVEVLDTALHISHFQPQHQGEYICAAVQYMVDFDGELQKTVKLARVVIELDRK